MKACPACGSTDQLATMEDIMGSALVHVTDDGQVEHDGETIIHWDTSTTTGGECRACGWESDGDDWTDALITIPDEEGEDE